MKLNFLPLFLLALPLVVAMRRPRYHSGFCRKPSIRQRLAELQGNALTLSLRLAFMRFVLISDIASLMTISDRKKRNSVMFSNLSKIISAIVTYEPVYSTDSQTVIYIGSMTKEELMKYAIRIYKNKVSDCVLEKIQGSVEFILPMELEQKKDIRRALTVFCNDNQCHRFKVEVNQYLLDIVLREPDIRSALPCMKDGVGTTSQTL